MSEHNNFKTAFDALFGEYKDLPVALYGIGKNAEIILNNAEGYNIFALIAQDHIGEFRYGKEVISIEEAAERAGMILIAAIPASTGIIYQRIQGLIPDTVPVFDMRGHKLKGQTYYQENPYWQCSREELFRLIDGHGVISFDIFDTLITRKALLPDDVFCLVERGLHERGVDIPFALWRASAEQACARETDCPSIDQIYKELGRKHKLAWAALKEAKELEVQIERQMVLPRKTMVEALQYALKRGKTVYLTSDMYFSKEIIQEFLKVLGISGYHDMLISCELGASKSGGGLYEILKEKASGQRILHIGDNWEADIVRANAHQIDAYQVLSGYAMTAASSVAYLLDATKSLDDRFLLGALVSEICNDPFALNPYDGKVHLNTYHDLALCIVPITGLFLSFIAEQARRYDAILFPSRDGFFLHRLYRMAGESGRKLPESFYFYASRSAVSSAAVFNEKDIFVFCSKVFEDKKLNLGEFLRSQFQIEVSKEYDLPCGEAVERWGEKGLWEKILSHKKAIFAQSLENRKKYLQYIQALGLERFEKIAIVDIVTQGTLVYGLSNILGKQIHLISLGTSALPNGYIRDLRFVSSVWGNVNEKWRDSTYSLSDFSQLHLFLELLYASGEGQFAGFSKEGKARFLHGTEYDRELIQNTQNEIIAFMNRHKNIQWKFVSKEFALSIMRMLYSGYTNMNGELRAKFSFSDPYDGNMPVCNLMDCLD